MKPWLVLAAIFLAGIATGCALSMVLGPRFHGPPGERDMRGHFMAFLTRRLELTDDQKKKVEPIVAETAQKIDALHKDEVDRGGQIIHAADDQIAAILTPEQKAELQKMQAEREKMFSGHHGPWGAGHRFEDHGGPNGPGDMPPPSPPEAPKDHAQ